MKKISDDEANRIALGIAKDFGVEVTDDIAQGTLVAVGRGKGADSFIEGASTIPCSKCREDCMASPSTMALLRKRHDLRPTCLQCIDPRLADAVERGRRM